MEERSLFDHVACSRTATVEDVTAPGALALDIINQADHIEVPRLDQLKYSKTKEIAFKKNLCWCSQPQLVLTQQLLALIESTWNLQN